MKTEEQLAAIARFELDHFPTLDRGVVSKDIVKEMREDFAVITAEPEVGLAVPVDDPPGTGNSFRVASSAPEIPLAVPVGGPVLNNSTLDAEEPAPKTRRGK